MLLLSMDLHSYQDAAFHFIKQEHGQPMHDSHANSAWHPFVPWSMGETQPSTIDMILWQLPHSTGSEKERSESATASAEFFSELQTRSVMFFRVLFLVFVLNDIAYINLLYSYLVLGRVWVLNIN